LIHCGSRISEGGRGFAAASEKEEEGQEGGESHVSITGENPERENLTREKALGDENSG